MGNQVMGSPIRKHERPRLEPFLLAGRMEAGCDEAGRGCLAGPVSAAAVILPEGFFHELLNDSKQLTENERNILRTVIEKEALAWAVAFVSPAEIDEINILNASFRAMSLAVEKLQLRPDHLLIDGNRFRNGTGIPHTCIVGGDARMMSIAAASVLAKTYRDEVMGKLHSEFPVYGWDRNKGYPTAAHREAILNSGVTPYHRQSFRLLDQQLKLFD